MLAVMAGTLVVVAGAVALVAMARTAVVMPMPGAVVAMVPVMTVVLVPMPGSVTAMARMVVVGRNEDEGVRRKRVPMPVPARMAAGMLASVVKAVSPRFVRYPENGSRGKSEEGRLAGRKVMAVLSAVTLSVTGGRRLDAESQHREQGCEQRG